MADPRFMVSGRIALTINNYGEKFSNTRHIEAVPAESSSVIIGGLRFTMNLVPTIGAKFPSLDVSVVCHNSVELVSPWNCFARLTFSLVDHHPGASNYMWEPVIHRFGPHLPSYEQRQFVTIDFIGLAGTFYDINRGNSVSFLLNIDADIFRFDFVQNDGQFSLNEIPFEINIALLAAHSQDLKTCFDAGNFTYHINWPGDQHSLANAFHQLVALLNGPSFVDFRAFSVNSFINVFKLANHLKMKMPKVHLMHYVTSAECHFDISDKKDIAFACGSPVLKDYFAHNIPPHH